MTLLAHFGTLLKLGHHRLKTRAVYLNIFGSELWKTLHRQFLYSGIFAHSVMASFFATSLRVTCPGLLGKEKPDAIVSCVTSVYRFH